MRQKQPALGPENLSCPDWQKPMSEVCHKCPLWTHLDYTDPETAARTEEWACAKAAVVVTQIKIIRELQIISQELNVQRNENKKAHDEQLTMAAIAVQRARQAIGELAGPDPVAPLLISGASHD